MKIPTRKRCRSLMLLKTRLRSSAHDAETAWNGNVGESVTFLKCLVVGVISVTVLSLLMLIAFAPLRCVAPKYNHFSFREVR